MRDKVGWFGLIALLCGTAGVLLYRGGAFYALDAQARVDHADYRMLSPGRLIGHGYGIVGTALIFTNLLYLARRALVRVRLGSMRAWLNLHVATGLLGGLLVLFHSAFQLRTALATLTMVALGVVLLTGLIGRFIFALVPTPDLDQLQRHCATFDALVPGLGREIVQRLDEVPRTNMSGRVSWFKIIVALPRWRSEAVERRRVVMETAERYAATHRDELTLLSARVDDTAAIAWSVPRAVAFETIMRSWRGMHRFFALLMILMVSVHIAVAWYFGYRWIFSDAGGAF